MYTHMSDMMECAVCESTWVNKSANKVGTGVIAGVMA